MSEGSSLIYDPNTFLCKSLLQQKFTHFGVIHQTARSSGPALCKHDLYLTQQELRHFLVINPKPDKELSLPLSGGSGSERDFSMCSWTGATEASPAIQRYALWFYKSTGGDPAALQIPLKIQLFSLLSLHLETALIQALIHNN